MTTSPYKLSHVTLYEGAKKNGITETEFLLRHIRTSTSKVGNCWSYIDAVYTYHETTCCTHREAIDYIQSTCKDLIDLHYIKFQTDYDKLELERLKKENIILHKTLDAFGVPDYPECPSCRTEKRLKIIKDVTVFNT